MVVGLLPAMGLRAFHLVRATAFVIDDEVPFLPIGALDLRVFVVLGLPPVVLPVVGVNADTFIVLAEVKRAPLRLEVEHVEVLIVFVVVDQLDFDILLTMGE